MQGVSDAIPAAVKTDHTAVCEVDIIQNGKVVAQLQPYDGAPPRSTAAQMRSARCLSGIPPAADPRRHVVDAAPFVRDSA